MKIIFKAAYVQQKHSMPPSQSVINIMINHDPINSFTGGTSNKVTKSKKAKLLRLLKLLKLLAYLEKDKKNRKNSQKNVPSMIDSNSNERSGHLKIDENPEILKNYLFSKAPLRHKSTSTSDLDALLNLVEGKKVTEAPNWNFGEGKRKQVSTKQCALNLQD